MQSVTIDRKLTDLAIALAQTGDYGNWRAVQTRLIQLGHDIDEVEAALSTQTARAQLTSICETHCHRTNGIAREACGSGLDLPETCPELSR